MEPAMNSIFYSVIILLLLTG
ncbi:TPA: RNA helicase, partial [Salmonella enterica subsp. enterica serovar Agona]|nr:RNA helicase [Salmonella enterica]HCL1433503.1 RNA helicase [Salmonella enterica subsp. enterica serovar Agona]HCL1501229.1 RNA helicase [Salmonella enterica subsp. enterica serovar Derby]ECT4627382.1 RNA helicase [Salmonella enterica]EIN4735869.1 RNA helicase [Salmonella enterica]